MSLNSNFNGTTHKSSELVRIYYLASCCDSGYYHTSFFDSEETLEKFKELHEEEGDLSFGRGCNSFFSFEGGTLNCAILTLDDVMKGKI